jgi:membrane protease YdiL (CAAX protease family)
VSTATAPSRSNPRLAAWLAFTVILAALAYAGRYLGGEDVDEDSRDVLYQWDAFVGGLFQYALMLGVVVGISAGAAKRDLFALVRPRSWPAALGYALLVLVATFVAAGVLRPLGDAGEEQGLLPDGWDSSRAAPFLANAVMIVLAAPVVEELTFRGLGYSLLARFGPAVAIAATGFLFGAVHGLVIGLPLLVLFGGGLAWLRHRTQSLYPCIALHAVFNGLALLAAVTLGDEA